jgi:hypothetical protein
VGSTFWLENHSPEIAKPAWGAGRAYRQGPGNSDCANLFSLTFPLFASEILPRADLCRFSAASGGLLCNLTEILMREITLFSNRLSRRREKVFGRGRCRPLDRNAKVRIMLHARAWSVRHRQPGQHRGPLTRATLEVLQALLWGFHNSRDGRCFPSYEAIAARAQCNRDTVHEAIKALEVAGVLTWVNRLIRVQFRERDLFGVMALRSRVVRTSNAYVFRDPAPGSHHGNDQDRGRAGGTTGAVSLGLSSESENPPVTLNQNSFILSTLPKRLQSEPLNPLGQALRRLQAAIAVEIATA